MSESNSEAASALDAAFELRRSRYVVGIDLGTTNCAMAYIDSQNAKRSIEVFRIEQLIDFGVVAKSDTLPSFHYELTKNEADAVESRFRFPASDRDASHPGIVGILARERSLQLPGRGIASAKSWLCHAMVDRESDLLPWHSDDQVERLSPVEASRRYLEHLGRAWDREHPRDPLSDQEVVVTLPASFDEVARRLTLEAAKRAGLKHVILIEEPQAAFYAWLDRHESDWMKKLQPGECILVCDIGGGTTDFTLIRVIDSAIAASTDDPTVPQSPTLAPDASKNVEQKLQAAYGLHRVAVGPHLLLGGDNLDLALAHYVEKKLLEQTPSAPLTPRQWDTLKAHARKAKEALLGNAPPEHYAVSLPGAGTKLIANHRTVTIEREWARHLLVDGFFGRVGLDSEPRSTEALFQEFGLPYETEPCVHKHLAHFLWEHRWAGRPDSDRARCSELLAARPDWVLFNGGVLESNEIQNAIVDQIADWFASESPTGWRPGMLQGNRLDLSVAMGAAYFGLVRRGEGIRIDARLSRAYYLLIEQRPPQAICVMPASAMPLERFRLEEHPFDLTVGEPVQFPLYYSSRNLTHAFGELVPVDPLVMTPLPPIQTVLEWGRGGRRRGSLPVLLESELSEIGTLQMSVVTQPGFLPDGETHRWSLEFDVRGATPGELASESQGALLPWVDSEQIGHAIEALEEVFGESPTSLPKECYNLLAERLQCNKRDWPPSLLRGIWKYLVEHADCRQRSAELESRWLNLLGWSLRPGFGFPADDWRVQCTWRLVHNKLMHRSASNVSESVILWRRIAGGFTAGQQNALFQDAWIRIKPILVGSTSGGQQMNTNVVTELLRLLGSLERLRNQDKSILVESALEGLNKKKLAPLRSSLFWMIGRLGSRTPMYASLQQTVPSDRVSVWLERLLQCDQAMLHDMHHSSSLALMQLARKTGDRYRDISDSLRERVLHRMQALESPALHRRLVAEVGKLDEESTATIVGESLPLGFTRRG